MFIDFLQSAIGHVDAILGLFGIGVGVFGIYLGYIAIRIGRRHEKEIKDVLKGVRSQLKKLQQLQGQVSTHFLSDFPDFILDISNLIKEARSSVLIFCDIPAYGQFSARSDWIQYSHAIENLEDDIAVEFICLDHTRRVAFYHEFLQGKPWRTWRDEPENTERLERLLLVKRSALKVKSLIEAEFVRLLEETNNLMLQGSLSRTKVKEIKSFMPTYFWLVDGTDAIFSVPVLHEGHTEYGFSTTDPKLIAALIDMKDRYLRRPAHDSAITDAIPSSRSR